MDKVKLIHEIRKSLEKDLEVLKEAERATREAATHEESKPENEYDTRGLEASYLAGAQSKRITETEELLVIFKHIELKYFNENSRYGSVKIDDKNKVTGFIEKNEKSCQSFINGGIYIISKRKFNTVNLPYKFSFEKDFLEKYYNVLNIHGLSFNNYFIDIGIPQDYNIAQNDFKQLKY